MLDATESLEPCAEGIRRSVVDLLPLEVPTTLATVQGRPGGLLVAQIAGPEDAPIARLTESTLDGERERIHEVSLGRFTDAVPTAIAGSGPFDVLFTTSSGVLLVVRFEDGAGAMFELDLPVAIVGLFGVAPAARGGFIAAAKLGFMRSALLAIDVEGVSVQEVDVEPASVLAPGGRGASAGWDLSALDGSGHVYGAYVDAESAAIIAMRVDTRSVPFVVERAAIGPTTGVPAEEATVQVSLAPGGAVIGVSRGDPIGVRAFWMEDTLEVRAAADVATGGRAARSVGVAGEGPDHLATLVYSDTGNAELRVAVAEAPGMVVGGARPLVTFDGSDGSPIAWTGLPGSISLAYQRGALEVMTLCAAP